MNHAGETVAQLIERGRFDEADRMLASALAHRETPELWNDWATAQWIRGHADRAEQGYRRALHLNPQERQPALNLAVLLLSEKRRDESLPLLESLAGRLTEEEKRVLRQLEGDEDALTLTQDRKGKR